MAALGMLWMGLALLGLLGFPQTLAQGEDHVSVQPYFQPKKFLGPWYVAALIPNTSLFRDKKNFICKTVLLANSTDGGISLTSTFPRRNHHETKIMMQPGKVPGQYHYPSPYSSNVQTISVVETNYDEYALLLSRGTKGTKGTGQPIYKSMLYSRTPTIKDELKEKFTTFSRAYGLTEEDIDFESQLDKCI